ncbi:MAG: FAD-dependent monooxygenase [Gemmatimonadaceae bacterium]
MPSHIPQRVHVAVLGGGPAGAAAAHLLADWGHDVLLVDRGSGRKALAESLPPSALPLLETLGVREAVDRAGFVHATGNTVWWGNGEMRVEAFPAGRRGYQVLSSAFDALLRTHASAAGAVVHERATALRVSGAPGEPRQVTIDVAGVHREVQADWVLDCTGRAAILARHVSRRSAPAVRTLALLGVWQREGGWDLPDESHTLVESSTRGWAWSIPVSSTARYFTVMLDPAHAVVADREGAATQYEEELARMPALGGIAARGRLASPPWACDATPYAHETLVSERALLVGDAASCIDPLSSFGVKKALASGWLAAIAVNTALRSPAFAGGAMEFFARREREVAQAATARLATLSRDALEGGASAFWTARAALADEPEAGDPAEALRRDPEVLAAFERLKAQPTVSLTKSARFRQENLLLIRDHQLVPELHLTTPPFLEGVRYLRGVDVLAVAEIATNEADVGVMYESYVRRHGRATLPDFLGALSVLLGKGVLDLA